MPLLVIRIVPTQSMSAADFEAALQTLVISAKEYSFANPDGGTVFGSAPYLPGDPSSRIVQHSLPFLGDQSVATALIKVPVPPEYLTTDVSLEITRGPGVIPHKARFFNVPLFVPADDNIALADLGNYQGIGVTSFHLSIPPSGQQLGSGPDIISLPDDGTPPNFEMLKAAVQAVLAADPGGVVQLKDLDLKKCKHIAYELAWNKRSLFPLPAPPRILEGMYTGPNDLDSDEERDRRKFEGDLQSYYAIYNAEAEKLTQFVYSLAAAHWAEDQSLQAKQVFYRFPVVPGAVTPEGKRGLTQLILEGAGGGAMNPSFSVTANFFYALGADLPVQLSPAERYQIAIREREEGLKDKIAKAIDKAVIDAPAGLTQWQAVRRLLCLYVFNNSTLSVQVVTDPAHITLLNDWLNFAPDDIQVFWTGLSVPNKQAHLDLMLRALSRQHLLFVNAVPASGGTEASIVEGWDETQWRAVVDPAAGGNIANIPSFILPGSDEERISAFLRYVKQFFDPASSQPLSPTPIGLNLSGFSLPTGSPIVQFFSGTFDITTWDGTQASIQAALDAVFPGDAAAQAQFVGWLNCIKKMLALTAGIAPPELQFSVIEALWARGITSKEIINHYSLEELTEALSGSVAYDHAAVIWANAGSVTPGVSAGPTGFVPINPDGDLVNCIPPAYRSPLGPVAYLFDLLRVSAGSTCNTPIVEGAAVLTLATLLAGRRGDIMNQLQGSANNLEIPLPLIDLVNESLESMVLNNNAHGAIYNTPYDLVGGHVMNTNPNPPAGVQQHDAETLLEVLPAHSTPLVNGASPTAYTILENDFSAPELPYSQALDINCSYLKAMKTCRYEVTRRFRKNITEFVLDPSKEPAEFQKHLWRYPVRIEVAQSYFCMSESEYRFFTTGTDSRPASVSRRRKNIPPDAGVVPLHQLYGFVTETTKGDDGVQIHWTEVIKNVPEFLDGTGLTYCEFIDLWKSGFVKFSRKGSQHPNDFPPCQPCCPEGLEIVFNEPQDPNLALFQLIVFIRLWRKLQGVKESSCNCQSAAYSFTELRDICKVLELFKPDGTLNPDFLRQLLAFQMFRDDFDLALTDGTITAGAVDAERTHILAFWKPGASKLSWAQQYLLDQIQQYAQEHLHCECREPEFIKLLLNNLESLSLLAGFESSGNLANNHWMKQPTKTLRFAEILAKIYASNFSVGDLLFLFSASSHLQFDDPLPIQTDNETLDSPFGLPDDDDPNSLYALRRKLLAAEPADTSALTWPDLELALANDLNMDSATQTQFTQFGWHFFPGILTASGIPLGANSLTFNANLPLAAPTSAPMWNTPANGPFQWIPASGGQLTAKIPLTDEGVIAKLSRIRQLNVPEQDAVQSLYFQPRTELARFAFLFENFGVAEEKLIQEPDETTRWEWFKGQFALCQARCNIIASHLAEHVASISGRPNLEKEQVAKLILNSLWADENKAVSPANWDDDSGVVPNVLWPVKPGGSAWAALLGLTGTGIEAEYFAGGALRWRDVRGGTTAFGPEENASNTPIPTVLPQMAFALPSQLSKYISVRNGYALDNENGASLGGAEDFELQWKGLMLIEQDGPYAFLAGLPTIEGEAPDVDSAMHHHRWKVTLRRGQKFWVLLSHDWPTEEAPAGCSKAIPLRKGMYKLDIQLVSKPLSFDDPEDVCPRITGFQLKYQGPDSSGIPKEIPYDKLFQHQKNDTLKRDLNVGGELATLLDTRYTSTVRDIRRTYVRAYKAVLFSHQLGLSAQAISDSGQSELGYMLAHPGNFAGLSYYNDGLGNYVTHKALFDFNHLPILDNYLPPASVQDERVDPTPQRQSALFDWWERLFDYTVMRQETGNSPEAPVWLLFHESFEQHPDDVAQLLRHLGISLNHSDIVQRYNDNPNLYELNSAPHSDDLDDDRWAVRAWKSEVWLRKLECCFFSADIRKARPDLWASLNPNVFQTYEATMTGNMNLTQFYRDGCIENTAPLRYADIKCLNDGLRLRGRNALVAYLTHLNRVPLPWGGFATQAKHLSELLLQDVETGLCQKASRIEEAVSALQLFVRRARLGLEPGFVVTADFISAWDRHFDSFRLWESCKRRHIYQENWAEWIELEIAKQSETFQFLEEKLREATLTVPVPGGLAYWNGIRPPRHNGITLLQHRQPSTIDMISPDRDGLGLMGTPDRHARPNWLAPMEMKANSNIPGSIPGIAAGSNALSSVAGTGILQSQGTFPLWLEAAVRLGRKFIRVAASGIPSANTSFTAKCSGQEEDTCCKACGHEHEALMDEYYFWIEPSEYFKAKEQNPDWGKTEEFGVSDWQREDKLPGLLQWNSDPMVELHWCRVHNGEFQQPRQSYEGVRVSSLNTADLVLTGRQGDSLYFTVTGGLKPIPEAGYPNTPPPGFRYDMAPDEAIILPEVVASVPPPLVGGMVAFPYFAFFDPGAPLLPPSMYSPALAVAGHLRAHCQFEAALKWYEIAYQPLVSDNTWQECLPESIEFIIIQTPTGPVKKEVVVPGNCCCASNPVSEAEAKNRAVLLHYLETMLQWGDALMRKNTPEAFQQARLIFETAARILGETPQNLVVQTDVTYDLLLAAFKPECAPLNPRLLCLYTCIDDRLSLIHACINAKRLKNGRPNLDMPYFGDSHLRECWKTNDAYCWDETEWCNPQSPYRFMVLIQKAQEITGEVRSLGGALLNAYEKMDAEYLSYMRTTHERQLLELTKEVRQLQWRESDWQVQALYKTKEIAMTRLQYYKDLIAVGLISGEIQYVTDSLISQGLRDAAKVAEVSAGIMQVVPDIYAGFPITLTHIPVGTKLAEALFQTVARYLNGIAEKHSSNGNLELTRAGWERREAEWKHQVDVLTIEIHQIERQILAAERRRDIALLELNNHQQQIENASEVHDFLRDKFTNHALYLWMQQETAALHYKMYELALHCARQAQRAFNFERGHLARNFIPNDLWDNLHEGLLAGERLSLALKQMDKAYYDENTREYEITKHISLRMHDPVQLLRLRETGYCEIELPEWLFDLDKPGHYMRRVKNVTVTLPSVAGPYTSINARLTLLSSKTRVSPKLIHSEKCCSKPDCSNGYETIPDDSRFVNLYATTEAIATSTGQQDSGMFELNFRDDRYLPFEFAGTDSRWRLELPHENNFFDMSTLTDVVMHLNYTAREGGDLLRKAANDCAQKHLPGDGLRLFDVKQEMTDAWYLFQSDEKKRKELRLALNRSMFPYLPGNQKVWVDGLDIFFETCNPCPSDGMTVQFKVDPAFADLLPDECDVDIIEIDCVRSKEWPDLYHGTMRAKLGPLPHGNAKPFGVFLFPEGIEKLDEVYLVLAYSTEIKIICACCDC
ncbi:MAG: neuraminidase-like domain-containing protein [Saprospiraceae bacterium]